MKIIILTLSLLLIGCNNSEFDKNLDAKSYLQAGMIDKAESYYQDLILKEDPSSDLWKRELLFLYIKSNQLDKADKYMAFAIFYDAKGSIDYEAMSRSHAEVGEALYDEKKYKRSMFHYIASADFSLSDENKSRPECNIDALGMIVMAHEAAVKSDQPSETIKLRARALKIINEKPCNENQLAQEYNTILNQ
jgi:lipopolysaccharide biosynthesis regulator YciM